MDEKQSFWNRVRMAMTFQRMAIAEMVGRTEPIETMYKKVTARFGAYKDITTFDASRTTYALARAIFFANEYSDKRTGKTYGKDYLLGAPFGKPIVNIAASFALGSAPQIIENDTVVDEEDAPTESPGLESPGEIIELETSPTVRNVNQWLDEIYNDLWTVIRNSYRDGDAYLVMDDDGEITIMPPEDVDIITDPEDPDVIIGYDVWTSFADPKVPNDNITYVDEIRRSHRVRMKVDKNENRTEVPGTRFEYRSAEDGGLEERELPVIHFANEKEPRMLYGISEFQSLYYLFANYHAVLAAAIKNNIYNSGAVPVIQGVKKLKEFLDTNFDKDKDGNYRVKWDSDKMLIIGEGGSAQILQADGTASDADSLLNILFWLIAQNSETPEFAFGTAVRSSKASVSEQTPMLVKKSVRKQGQLSEPLRKLIDLYIQRMAVIRPEEFDAELTYTIDMPDILDDDLNINIQIVNTLLEKGIITEETAMVMLNVGKFVKDTALELKRAKQQKEARNPIPTDAFGQPITDGSKDKAERERVAKQKEIDEMKKHKETRNVAEMLQKNMDVLELEQIISFNPYHKDVVQETRVIKPKSGNPYRDSSGRFGTGPSKDKKKSDLESQIANAKDVEIEKALYDYQDYDYDDINSYLAIKTKLANGEKLYPFETKKLAEIEGNEDRLNDILSKIKAIDGQFAKETVSDQHLYRTDHAMLSDLFDKTNLTERFKQMRADGKLPMNHNDYYEAKGGDFDIDKILNDKLNGITYTSGAFLSTSRTKAGGDKFGDGSKLMPEGFEAHLRLTGKSKAINVDKFTGSGREGNIESESLLPRGTGIKITGLKLVPTSREGYSGVRGEVFFVEINGQIIPVEEKK